MINDREGTKLSGEKEKIKIETVRRRKKGERRGKKMCGGREYKSTHYSWVRPSVL